MLVPHGRPRPRRCPTCGKRRGVSRQGQLRLAKTAALIVARIVMWLLLS